jgi:hypothetical protein
MDSAPQGCSRVLAELSGALQAGMPANLSSSTYDHLSTCSRCRAGLLLLIRALDPKPDRSGTSDTCDQCQADLAAFIDLEAENPALAAATYPHVWWHLWTCETCSQTYEFTHILLDGQRSGELAPMRLPKRTARQVMPAIQRVHLPRKMLALALPQRPLARPVFRGADDDRYVLFDDTEDEPERRQLTIIVEEQDERFWSMHVTVIPPPNGLIVLTAGTLRLVAPFGPDGTATITNIPSEILLGPDSPDIEIGIVPVEEP